MNEKVSSKQEYELLKRCMITIGILCVYLIGRRIPIFGVDVSSYTGDTFTAQDLMLQMVSGDLTRTSFLALGISPYITASILIQIYMAMLDRDVKGRISPQRSDKITFAFAMVFAAVMAASRASELNYFSYSNLSAIKVLAAVQMMAGAAAVVGLGKLNQENGIGRLSIIIAVNVTDGIRATLTQHTAQSIRLALILCLYIVIVSILMENTLVKIPVQRVSVYSIYSNKNYIAFKLNPIGMRPVMFATTFLMIPQIIAALGCVLFPQSAFFDSMKTSLVLTEPGGIIAYLVIVFCIAIVFSFVFLEPWDIADRLQQGGDSIVGVHSGTATRRFLYKKLFFTSLFSGSILVLLMGASLFLSLRGIIESELALLPASFMILTSMVISVVQEGSSYFRNDSYKPLI